MAPSAAERRSFWRPPPVAACAGGPSGVPRAGSRCSSARRCCCLRCPFRSAIRARTSPALRGHGTVRRRALACRMAHPARARSNAAFVLLFGAMLWPASRPPRSIPDAPPPGQRRARAALRHLHLRLLLRGLRTRPHDRRHPRRAPALLRRRRVRALRLRRLLLSVSRARRLRSAIRLARFRRLPSRAGTVLRGQHAGQFLRVLPGDDRRRLHPPAPRIAGLPHRADRRGRRLLRRAGALLFARLARQSRRCPRRARCGATATASQSYASPP